MQDDETYLGQSDLMKHLQSYNILWDVQYGFIPYHSCSYMWLLTADNLVSAIDNNLQIDMAILDCLKTFRKVLHTQLINKLIMKTRRIIPLKNLLYLINVIVLSGPILHVQKQFLYRVATSRVTCSYIYIIIVMSLNVIKIINYKPNLLNPSLHDTPKEHKIVWHCSHPSKNHKWSCKLLLIDLDQIVVIQVDVMVNCLRNNWLFWQLYFSRSNSRITAKY